MLIPFRRLYCVLGISLVVLIERYTNGSFNVIRGKFRDQFVNTLCTSESCPSVSCENYNAVCSFSGCQYCVCNRDNQNTTYYHSNGSSNGKCMQDLLIARNVGCFNSWSRHSIHTFDTSCTEHCIEKVKILAFNGSSNTTKKPKCILKWASSSFSINNQYWKPTGQLVNDFSLIFDNTAKQLYAKLNLEAYKRWAGALLKLQIECHSPPTEPYHSKNICVILKFTGKYTPYHEWLEDELGYGLIDAMQLKFMQLVCDSTKAIVGHYAATFLTEMLVNHTMNTTVEMTTPNKRMQKLGDQYLTSTIALSAILFLVFVFLGFGIFLLLRKNDRRSSAEHTLETDTATTHQEEIQLTVQKSESNSEIY